jgi:urease accessory protein UreH
VEAQPRARGAVRLTAKAVGGATKLDRLRQQGALKLILPTLFRDDLEAVLVNTSGGVTGGDELSVEVTAREGTTVSVTTQAAERLYRAQPGECARISNRVDVEAGARLNWLPQETILFDRCSARRTLDVELAVGAAFLMVESLIFGRAAMGEVLRAADFNDRIAIRRTGVPGRCCAADDGPGLRCGRASGQFNRAGASTGGGILGAVAGDAALCCGCQPDCRGCVGHAGGCSRWVCVARDTCAGADAFE